MSAPWDDRLDRAYEHFRQNHDALREALLASLPTRSEAVASRGRITQFRHFLGATIMRDRITKLATAALIALAALIGVSQFGGNHTAVFADTMAQIEKAHSVVFTETFCNEDGTKRWSSRQMATDQGILRTEMEFGTVLVSDYSRGILLQLEPSRKHAIVTYRVGEKQRTRLSSRVGWATSLHQGAKPIGQEKIDGKMTNAFFSDQPFEKTTVWVDPQTDLPIRAQRIDLRNPRADIVVPTLSLDAKDFGAETSSVSSMSGSDSGRGIQEGQIIVYSDFQWNVELDESLFSLEPPADYTVERKQHDVADKGDLALVEALSVWTEMTGGTFPARIDDLVDPNLVKPLLIAKFDRHGDPKEERDQAMAAGRVLLKASWFAQQHKVDNNWWYAGAGVKLGDADKAICWWKQGGAKTYRVVYGNLHIGDADEMPPIPSLMPPK